jgi:predicted transcriptional regulator of viral defense system
MRTRPSNQASYEALYRVAEQQGGYFDAAQARSCGFSRRQLAYYVKTGRFERIKPGLYRLALFPASAYDDLFAAWVEVGPQSVISHESALALYELSDALPSEIHLIVPRTTSRRRRGLRLHTNRLCEDEITSHAGLRVTGVPRTIADVAAAGLAAELVVQAVNEAVRRGLATKTDLRSAAERRGGRARRLVHQALEEANDEVPEWERLP